MDLLTKDRVIIIQPSDEVLSYIKRTPQQTGNRETCCVISKFQLRADPARIDEFWKSVACPAN
jgi:hypothetical protein